MAWTAEDRGYFPRSATRQGPHHNLTANEFGIVARAHQKAIKLMRHHPLTTTGTGASDKRRPSAPPPPTQRETAMRARARMRHVPRAKTRGKRARERGGVPGVPRAGDGSGGGCGVSRDTAFWVAARRHSTAAVSRVNKASSC
ncbi:hypothetical protein HWV62_2764, partial [Athelia sp. TMB]